MGGVAQKNLTHGMQHAHKSLPVECVARKNTLHVGCTAQNPYTWNASRAKNHTRGMRRAKPLHADVARNTLTR